MSNWLRALLAVVVLLWLLNLPIALIWLERRLLGWFQDRYGPNRVGPFGLLQPIADGLKLFLKEDWVPPFADRAVFILAPAILATTVLMAFAVVPFVPWAIIANVSIGLLFFLAMASLGVYSIVLAGWSSNSKYSLIGVVILAGSFRLADIVGAQRHLWFIIPQFAGFVIFLIAGFAESRRIPFDLPEADSELVAGYHTEYSSMKFALFYLGEYLDIVLISAIATVLFLGGWLGVWLPGLLWFWLKVGALVVLFIWARSVLPRFRFDQLMDFGWKVLLPLALLNILVTGAIVVGIG